MSLRYEAVASALQEHPRTWLVTGAAGFIGSHLVEGLLALGQVVVGMDNFATGSLRNLEELRAITGDRAWDRFHFVEADIRNLGDCRRVLDDGASVVTDHDASEPAVDYVLHQAALGSVPRSLKDPLATHASNATGFLNMALASSEAGVRRFVYAASSSTYGDSKAEPKVEDQIGRPLSPYAVTKYTNELYATVFDRAYGLDTVGLRYFNVFGPRQDPDGAYAAVIPKWIAALRDQDPVYINGDGETSRDFTYVANVVQANLLAATAQIPEEVDRVFNVAVGERTTLNEVLAMIRDEVDRRLPRAVDVQPIMRDFRPGDVRHSWADISKAETLLGYRPSYRIRDGLTLTVEYFLAESSSREGGWREGVRKLDDERASEPTQGESRLS